MTPNEFRAMALSFPEATEGAHMEHPDFRVRGKIFATLWPDGEWGAVLLTPIQQAEFMESSPDAFTPAKGGWGRKGHTQVHLHAVDPPTLRAALTTAWCRIAPKRLVAQSGLTGG